MASIKYNFAEAKSDSEEQDRTTEIGGHKFERRDPNGFWHAIDPPSKELSGAFTHISEVHKAIHRHDQSLEAEVNKARALEAERVEADRMAAIRAAEVARRLAKAKQPTAE